LGLVDSVLWRWVNLIKLELGGITPTTKALTAEQQKTQELQDRINRLELEKKILKEATAILMAEERGRRR
jgi:transposase